MKTEKAKKLFSSGAITEALRIFKTFKIGFTMEEKRTLKIAYECMAGNESFYQSIGINTQQEKQQALSIIQRKYFKKRV